MERKKSKILTHYDEILDEKFTLQDNLEKVISQVFSCVDHIKKFPDEIKQKDCSLILKHQLEVLKKFTEINYELESLIEENPLKVLNINEKLYENDRKKCQEESKIEILEESNVVVNQKTLDSSTETDFNSVACSSAYISELISGTQSIAQNNISGDDIQTFRNTLKKFSEKFGLNAECMSSMKDYYEKPSCAIKEIFNKPSTSQTHDFSIDNVNSGSTNLEANSTNTFDIPEKDTNIVITSESDINESCVKVHLPIESASNTSICPQANANENIIGVCRPNEIIKTEICCDESDFSSETELPNALDTEKITSNDETFSASKIVIKTSDLTADLIDSDSVYTKSVDNISEPKKIVYTALEKLNNAKIFDRREEALKKLMTTVDVPDIKLKPAASKCTSVIKNDFETNNTKLRKKKNRKKKEDIPNNVFHELKSKAAPTVGTLCAISHVESPNEFYIHVADEECGLIDMITEQINEFFMDTTSDYTLKETACTMIGTYCFAFIAKYNGWYRAKILDWCLENKSDEVLLQLVDYGNKHRTSYVNLRKLTNELIDVPMLAIRCHLPLMYPPHSTYLNRLTVWPSETIDAFLELSGLFQTEPAENKLFKIVYAHQEGISVAIDLYNPQESTEEYTVGQILLDLGMAVQILENYDENNLELEEYLQDIDTLENADNINEAIVGYDPRDEARICPFTKSDGSCFKGKHCKLEHVPLSKDGFTTDTIPVFMEAMYSLQLPAHGELINILITGYKDTCNFFAQIIRTPHKDKKYFIDQNLYMLLEDMNYPKTVSTYETFKISPAIGEIVIANHWSKKWLRAVVRERFVRDDESEEFAVFTLDFGDYLRLPLNGIRKIKPHHLELPFQAVECYVHNYKAKKNCDPQKAQKFFYKNLCFQNFSATAMSTSLPLKVGVKTFNGFDVGKTLAENGFAEERTYDHNPIDGCPIELY